MFTFTDLNGLKVDLYFHDKNFKVEPRHVLVIVKKGEYFLCTIHSKRGVEFPGGKVEGDETLFEAAEREVLEETNVIIKANSLLGYYIVRDEVPFSKAIIIAEVVEQLANDFQFETTGRKWVKGKDILKEPNLSFYMKDEGMKRILQEVNNID